MEPPRRPERNLLVRLPPPRPEETTTPPQALISLEAPRPNPSRASNLYVESPLSNNNGSSSSSYNNSTSSSAGGVGSRSSSSSRSSNGRPNKSEFKQSGFVVCRQPATVIQSKDSHHQSSRKGRLPPRQPPHKAAQLPPSPSPPYKHVYSSSSRLADTLPLEEEEGADGTPSSSSSGEEDSIICRDCGKCKCLACATPKNLPQKMICSGKVLCSPESTLETLSCLCCVKGAFYHCQKDSEREDDDDDFSCSPPNGHCCLRWTALGALSLLMPCLWCYLPLQGCLRLANYVYGRASVSGCTCSPNHRQRQQQQQTTSADGLMGGGE